MHPLVGKLSELSDDELFIKLNDLNSRLAKAYRFGYSDAVSQLLMILEEYQWEFRRRQEKAMQELEEAAKKNGDFKDFINIG